MIKKETKKQTGVVKTVDDSGRFYIPCYIRAFLGINESVRIELNTDSFTVYPTKKRE